MERQKENNDLVREIRDLCEKYNQSIKQEMTCKPEELVVANVGKLDAKKHIENSVNTLLSNNTLNVFSTMLAIEML